MNNKIIIFDTTLRDGEQASGFHMFAHEKMQIAKALADMGVNVIEAGFAISSPGDADAIYNIAKEVGTKDGPIICSLSRANITDIDAAANAIKPAYHKRIHTFIATSDIHTEKKLRKSKQEIIDMAVTSVKYAKQYTDDVEFSTEDFSRTATSYLLEVVTAAIQAGATTINLPDTVGYLTPDEIYDKVKDVIQGVGKRVDLENIVFSFHCHDDLGNATANCCKAILAGVRQIEVTINGIGERAGNTSLEQVIANIRERGKYSINPHTGKPDPFYGLEVSHIKTQMIGSISKLVAEITGVAPQPNSPLIGRNSFAHEAGIHQDGVLKERTTYEWMDPEDYGVESIITFGPRSGRNALRAKYKSLGIKLTNDEFQSVAKIFTSIADKVKEIDDADIIRSLEDGQEIPSYYQLVDYHPIINGEFGNVVKMKIGDTEERMYHTGNGQIDAGIKAIKSLMQKPEYHVKDYRAEAEGEGEDATGKTRLIVYQNGWKVIGKAENTDVVKSSLMAFIAGCNRMKYIEDYFHTRNP